MTIENSYKYDHNRVLNKILLKAPNANISDTFDFPMLDQLPPFHKHAYVTTEPADPFDYKVTRAVGSAMKSGELCARRVDMFTNMVNKLSYSVTGVPETHYAGHMYGEGTRTKEYTPPATKLPVMPSASRSIDNSPSYRIDTPNNENYSLQFRSFGATLCTGSRSLYCGADNTRTVNGPSSTLDNASFNGTRRYTPAAQRRTNPYPPERTAAAFSVHPVGCTLNPVGCTLNPMGCTLNPQDMPCTACPANSVKQRRPATNCVFQPYRNQTDYYRISRHYGATLSTPYVDTKGLPSSGVNPMASPLHGGAARRYDSCAYAPVDLFSDMETFHSAPTSTDRRNGRSSRLDQPERGCRRDPLRDPFHLMGTFGSSRHDRSDAGPGSKAAAIECERRASAKFNRKSATSGQLQNIRRKQERFVSTYYTIHITQYITQYYTIHSLFYYFYLDIYLYRVYIVYIFISI